MADLCDSCQNCEKVSGSGRELKVCRAFQIASGDGDDRPITFPVEVCTAYDMKGTLSRYELEQMAVYIEKKKDSPGFKFTKHVNGQQVDFK